MIKNARIHSRGTWPREYYQQPSRGNPEYVVSPSVLKLFGKSPRKWKAGVETPESESLEYGSLLDTRLLTPAQFGERYAIQPATYKTIILRCPKCGSITKAATCRDCKTERERHEVTNEWSDQSHTCQQWTKDQEAAGKEIAWQSQLADTDAAIKRLMDEPAISTFLRESEKQVWVKAEWHDTNGLVIPIQCLIDLVPTKDSEFCKSIGDVKSTRDGDLKAFGRDIFKFGHYIQAAFNLDMISAALPDEDRMQFCLILSERKSPFEPGLRAISNNRDSSEDGYYNAGHEDYQTLLRFYCHCLQTGTWPGYEYKDPFAVQGWSYPRMENWMNFERPTFTPPKDQGQDDAPPDDGEIGA